MHSSHLISWLCRLTLAVLASSLAISPPAAYEPIQRRAIRQGWSLQASTCPSGDTSCGNGACCPSSLFCISAASDEVDACCTTNSACRGSIEGNPICADSSWSLWKGFQGSERLFPNCIFDQETNKNYSNGFCCQVGLVGVYNSQSSVAGTCVASTATSGYTTAVLVSRSSQGYNDDSTSQLIHII
jgi:glucan endo-1,3-alpha-glucosidase